MAKLPEGSTPPDEVITNLFDKRLFEISLAGIFNNRSGVLNRITEQGLGGVDIAALADVFDPDSNDAYRELLEDPEVRKVHDEWYYDLYAGGFKRVFGSRALRRQSELRSTQTKRNSHPIPVPVFVGELPELLDNDETRDTLQQRLDLRYGKHGVLAGPPPVVMALYDDIGVSLRPSARTLIQGKTEVWQLETTTDLRGPATARMGG